MMNQAGYERREASYRVPDVTLIDHSGKRVSVAKLLNGDEPVMLNFIFTSCTTICPVLSATFSQVQKEYGSDLDGVKMISISIDPEYDTPARLQEYAERFNAPEGWIFLTGELDDVTRILTAFDAYRGDKMNHVPLTFVRVSANAPWVRLEGFPGANDLLREYRLSVSEYSK
jgi:protein SCO1